MGKILIHVWSEIIMYSCNLILIICSYNCRSSEEVGKVDETLVEKWKNYTQKLVLNSHYKLSSLWQLFCIIGSSKLDALLEYILFNGSWIIQRRFSLSCIHVKYILCQVSIGRATLMIVKNFWKLLICSNFILFINHENIDS